MLLDSLVHVLVMVVLLLVIYLFDKDYHAFDKKFLTLSLFVFGSLLIHVDHFLATPIYDPSRCSINTHPLHSWYVFPLYFAGLFLKDKRWRYAFVAVWLHLALDGIACLLL